MAFYGLLSNNSSRPDIGSTRAERKKYGYTALYTAIVYLVFIFLSIGCIYKGQVDSRRPMHQDVPDGDEEDVENESDPIYTEQQAYSSTEKKFTVQWAKKKKKKKKNTSATIGK